MSHRKNILRAKGIAVNEVSPSRFMHAPLSSLWVAPKGHPLHDPRSLDPVDTAMADNMAARVAAGECPNTNAILVLEQGDKLIVGDGHGRTAALHLVECRRDEGAPPLMPLVEFFVGNEAEFLLERMRRNDHGRFARLDRPSVLAFRVKQLVAVGASEADIVAACPKGIGPREVEALARWGSLSKEARERFDDGAPVGLLATVLEEERSDQIAALDRLLAAGVKTSRQAARQATKAKAKADPWARPMSPKKLASTADALEAINKGPKLTALGASEIAAIVYRIAAGSTDAEKLLRRLPGAVADAIRAARMGAK